MKENCKKYVIAKSIPNLLDDCKITIGKSYEVVKIIYKTKSGKWGEGEFFHNPKEPTFYITIKEDDNGVGYSIYNHNFYSTDELRDLVIDDILE